jgi:electron transport complex protein RnfC
MIKQLVAGLTKPCFPYETLPQKLPEAQTIAASAHLTLLHRVPGPHTPMGQLAPGDTVKTGQRLAILQNYPEYVISSTSGTVASISPYTGDYGQYFHAIFVKPSRTEEIDEDFSHTVENPTAENAANFLSHLPGKPPFELLARPGNGIDTIVISALDDDLLVGTNQYIFRSRLDDLKKGIQILKQVTDVERIIIAAPAESVQGYGHLGADVRNVEALYPAALPQMIMYKVLGRVVPAGKRCEDLGVCFFKAEAVATLGEAYESGRIPVIKTLTLIDKDRRRRFIKARLGTPIRDIFATFNIDVHEKDRVVFGGPMRGSAVYSLETPVEADTDAIMVIDGSAAAYVSDYPCINCGQCVRVCPARMQINLLVRFLEAGQYEAGADAYDLYSCIECGLCSYVCVSKIPIFQYITLAKYELERLKSAEATNG